MKQLFRIGVILFSMLFLMACGQEQTAPINESQPLSSKESELALKSEQKESIQEDEQVEDEANQTEELEEKIDQETDTLKESVDRQNTSSTPKHPKDASQAKITKQATEKKSSEPAETKTAKQPTQTEPKKEQPAKAEPKETVTISVEKPSDVSGPSISNLSAEIQSGDTILSISKRALGSKNITFNTTGSGATAYVKGISGLEEFDEGPLSGWNVYVNGAMISKSSDAVKASNGDTIRWVFTKNHLEN